MPELIWEGKYDAQGRKIAPQKVALPFQTVETVNESAADRERARDLFTSGRKTDWRNRLIWGDKKYVLPSLLPEFAGQVNLIYIDPPFATGADFSFTARIPDNTETEEDESAEFLKQPSMIEMKAYRDTWGKGLDGYLKWFYETAVFLHELLAGSGSIYVHCDYRVNSSLKLILDEFFGNSNFRNEIYAKRKTKILQNQFDQVQRLNIAFDSLIWYSKNSDQRFRAPTKASDGFTGDQWNNFWNNADRPTLRYPLLGINPTTGQWRWKREKAEEAVAYYQEYIKEFSNNSSLYEYWKKTGEIKRFIKHDPGSTRCYYWVEPKDNIIIDTNWFDIYAYDNAPNSYPTQKSEAFLERIINAASNEGDLVLDCFCGSGTTAAVAEKHNRRWIAADLGRFAIHTTRKRLLGIPNVRPFIVQNLGKYERQIWQSAEFGEENARRQLAYRKFILDLYHATELPGFSWLHGVKAGRIVHVGSVDSPVTESDLANIAVEFKKAMGSGGEAPLTNGVDVLGWDFAFEVNEVAKNRAELAGLDVHLKKIPMDVMDKRAVDQGDVKFFELAALEVKTVVEKRKLAAQITNFIIPQDDLPEEVRGKITHWSQWIDYWAIDWDYKDDTFHNQWQSYRTRKDNSLQLKAEYKYETAGNYKLLVKVVDILGNDTTKMLAVEVK